MDLSACSPRSRLVQLKFRTADSAALMLWRCSRQGKAAGGSSARYPPTRAWARSFGPLPPPPPPQPRGGGGPFFFFSKMNPHPEREVVLPAPPPPPPQREVTPPIACIDDGQYLINQLGPNLYHAI